MELIIDPMFFYWLNAITGILIISLIGLILSCLATIIGMMVAFVGYTEEDKAFVRLGKRILKIFIPLVVFFALLVTFVPNSDTLIKMKVAGHITEENVSKLINVTGIAREAIKKDVIEIIDAINKKEETQGE